MLEIRFSFPRTGLTAGQAGQILTEELTAATEAGLSLLHAAVVPETPVGATGGLRKAWQTTVDLSGAPANIGGRLFNPMLHALPVEDGTKPHWPPSGPLELWVRRKLGVSEREVKGVAYVIARAIARRGTRAVHMARRGLAETRGQVNARFERALARIRERLGNAA